MATLGDGFKSIFLAGIGAVAIGAEKGKDLVDQLVARGEMTVEQGKQINTELKHRADETASSIRRDAIEARMSVMSPDERIEFANIVREMADSANAREAEQAAAKVEAAAAADSTSAAGVAEAVVSEAAADVADVASGVKTVCATAVAAVANTVDSVVTGVKAVVDEAQAEAEKAQLKVEGGQLAHVSEPEPESAPVSEPAVPETESSPAPEPAPAVAPEDASRA